MNALTGARVLVADQPFATLDPTTRRLALPDGRKATVSDTVGFVRKLPHELVEAFKSTLEEVTRSDLIVHVADASSSDVEQQIEAVRTVLAEIGAGTVPEVLALNKWDAVDDLTRARLMRRHPDAAAASALNGDGLDEFLEIVARALPVPPIEVELLVPYSRPDVVPALYRRGQVLASREADDGIRVRARIETADLHRVEPFLVQPVAARVRP